VFKDDKERGLDVIEYKLSAPLSYWSLCQRGAIDTSHITKLGTVDTAKNFA
jgi:hypothetical protein